MLKKIYQNILHIFGQSIRNAGKFKLRSFIDEDERLGWEKSAIVHGDVFLHCAQEFFNGFREEKYALTGKNI